MAKFTAGIGLALVLLGGIMYMASESGSVTALIPAFFGLPVLLLGLLGMIKPRFRKHAAHVAVLITLLGAIGSGVRGLPALPTLLSGTDEISAPAATSEPDEVTAPDATEPGADATAPTGDAAAVGAQDDETPGPLATVAQIIMFGICVLHVVVAIGSFVKARGKMKNN